jgi:hypothetical protein
MRDEIIQYIKDGHNYSDTGKMFGRSRERIRQIAKEEGVDIKKLKKTNPLLYSKRERILTLCVICGKQFATDKVHPRKSCSRDCKWHLYSQRRRECRPKDEEAWRRHLSEAQTKRWAEKKSLTNNNNRDTLNIIREVYE